MKLLGWLIFSGIMLSFCWFFCRGVGAKSSNKNGLHGGGIDSISDGVDSVD